MSKIKDLKNDPSNNINIVEIFKDLFPQLKTKYIELLLRLSKNSIKNSSFYKDILNKNFDISEKINFEEYTPYETIFISLLINEFIRVENLDTFIKFAEYNENNQIENNDLTSIKDMSYISNEVSKVEMKTVTKDMVKQIIKLHEDDTWLIIKPLTFMASRKYGSNTKWCTTSNHNVSYFREYANNGILIYVLNKKTGWKVALYKDLRDSNGLVSSMGDLSFWNQKDQRIDSMEADLPMDIFMILAADIKECKVPNRKFLSNEEKLKEAKLFPEKESKISMAQELINEQPLRNAIRVADVEEEMEMAINSDVNEDVNEDVPWSGPYNPMAEDDGILPPDDGEQQTNERVMDDVKYNTPTAKNYD